MAEKVQCPNCLGDAEKEGKLIICLTCDAVFEIKKTGAAKVVKLGELEELKGRVDALEALLAPEPELDEQSLAEAEAAAAGESEDEDDIIPR